MKKKFFLKEIITIIFVISPLYSIGTAFLNIPFTPKGLALAGAGIAVLGDPSLFRLNPALVVQNHSGTEIYFAYNAWLAGTSGHSVVAVNPLKGGSLALGLRSFSIAGLELRTSRPTDDPISNFSSSGTALEAAWGKKRGPLQLGGTIRLLRIESFIYSSSGLGLDGGITYSLNSDKVITGIAIRNIGIMKKFNKVTPELPTILSMGIVFRSYPKVSSVDLLTAISTDHSDWYGTVYRFGGELGWEDIVIWGGANSSRELTSFSGGVGFKSRIFTIGYGFQVSSNNLGIPHILQIQLSLQ